MSAFAIVWMPPSSNVLMYLRSAVPTALVTLAGAIAAPSAQAATLFTADLNELNNSGVTGTARLELLGGTSAEDATSLQVDINATGLVPEQTHPQNIHGRFENQEEPADSEPIDSVVPTPANDSDEDGFVELLEGVPAYGLGILPLSSPPAASQETLSYPTAPDGTINFTETYDLSNDAQFFEPVMGTQFTSDNIFPLESRAVVLLGGNVPEGVGEGTSGGVNGSGGYVDTLPVAAGEFQKVPEPSSWGGILALGTMGIYRLRNRKNQRKSAFDTATALNSRE